jgi:ATP-binding cassette subfamily C (CFTR/MRP) protein 1
MRLCKPLYYRGTSADFTQIVLLLSAGLQLAILVLWIVSSGQRNKTSIASSSLTFGSALLLCVLSHFEHTRTVRPSTIIDLAAILSASLVVKIAVLFLEAKSKKDILTKSYSNLSPETTSGIFGRSTFYWIKPLLMAGFISTISIDESPPLDTELSSESLHNRLQRTWDRCKLTIFSSRTLLDKLMML